MDCSICTSLPFKLRPPRNTICVPCFEGARSVIDLMNKLDVDLTDNNKADTPLLLNSTKPHAGLANVTKWMNLMKEREEAMNKKISFLSEFVVAFKQQVHPDILLLPGDNGPPIPAHKALLAAKSEIFKNMLDSDRCKAPASESITLGELKSAELESLLEFLYSGTLSVDRLEKDVYSLFVAADKYEIPYLQEFCERHMLASLNSANALDVLEISDLCPYTVLKETALNFVVRNMEDIAYSAKYEAFVPNNPHLCVQITRAFLMEAKDRKATCLN